MKTFKLRIAGIAAALLLCFCLEVRAQEKADPPVDMVLEVMDGKVFQKEGRGGIDNEMLFEKPLLNRGLKRVPSGKVVVVDADSELELKIGDVILSADGMWNAPIFDPPVMRVRFG